MQSKQDKGWQSMQSILDREMPVEKKKRRLLFLWWSGVAMIIALATAVIMWNQNKESDFVDQQQEVAITHQDFNNENDVDHNTIAINPTESVQSITGSVQSLVNTSKIRAKAPAMAAQQRPIETSSHHFFNQLNSEEMILNESGQVETSVLKSVVENIDTELINTQETRLPKYQLDKVELLPYINMVKINKLSIAAIVERPSVMVKAQKLIDVISKKSHSPLKVLTELSYGFPSRALSGIGVDINLNDKLKISPHIGFGLGRATNQESLDSLSELFRDVDLGSIAESAYSNQYKKSETSFSNYVYGVRVGWQLSHKIRPFVGYTGVHTKQSTSNTLNYVEGISNVNENRNVIFSPIEQSSTHHMLSFGLHYTLSPHWYITGSGYLDVYHSSSVTTGIVEDLNPPEGFNFESFNQPEPIQPMRFSLGLGYTF